MGSETTLIGRTFAGRYRISGLIGEGGMATVYRGEVIAPAARDGAPDGAATTTEPQKPAVAPVAIPSGPALGSVSRHAAGSAPTPTAAGTKTPAAAANGPSPEATTAAEQSSNDALPHDDPNASGDVAIKVMNAQLARDATFVKRFQREAKAAARLKHRSTVRIHSWGVEDGLPYIVMELIPGAELVRILHHEKRLPEARAARIMAQVCSALAAAHDLGIVHRDLKPENVMVVRDPKDPTQDRIKVLDFGIAKTLEPEMRSPDALPMDSDEDPPSSRSALTMVGTLVGTPEYMSPEQSRGAAVDTRSDIYTCGLLLYQMVTGRVPFTGDTPFEIAIRQVEEQPKPPSSLVRGLSPRLENLILRAIAKAPGDRPQSAREMQEELLEMLPELSNNPAQSMHPGPAPRPAAGRASPPDEIPKLMTPLPDSDQAVTRRWPFTPEVGTVRAVTLPIPPTPAAGAPPPASPPATMRMDAKEHAAAIEAARAARAGASAPAQPAPLAATPPRPPAADARLDPPTPLGARQIKRHGLSNAAALGLGVLLGGAIIALLTLVLTLVR